jgi:DNA-binding NarL/FixJ family response regulator
VSPLRPVPDAQLRVLVACGEALARAGYRAVLEAAPRIAVAGEAATGAEAIQLARQLHADAVVMDVGISACDCVEATRQLNADPEVPVLLLCAADDDERVFAALRAGASSALSKDAAAHELVGAVELATRGDAVLSPGLTRRLIAALVSRPEPSRACGTLLAGLTPREREVVALVGLGLSNDEIAQQIVVSPATARTHVSRAMVKLRARDRAQLVVLAYQSNLLAHRSRA